MPKKGNAKGRVVSIYLPEPVVNIIDRMAEKEELGNRSALIKKLLLLGLRSRGVSVDLR